MANKFEQIQEKYGLSVEQVRRAQVSFASNLTGRYETKSMLNGDNVVLYFSANGRNNKPSIVHVYEDERQYSNTEWAAMSQNLGFIDKCLDDEYIGDVILNTDEKIIEQRLEKMKENMYKNTVLDNKNVAYYTDLVNQANSLNKIRTSADESGM